MLPVLKSSRENSRVIIKSAAHKYRDYAGISALSIGRDVENLINRDNEDSFSFLSRITPCAKLEKFYYDSPDTGLPAITALNNVRETGSSLMYLGKLLGDIDQGVISKLLSSKGLLDAISIVGEALIKKELTVDDIAGLKDMSLKKLHKYWNEYLQKNIGFFSETRDCLVKMCGDLGKHDFTNGKLSRVEAIKLLRLIELSCVFNVLDGDLSLIKTQVDSLIADKKTTKGDVRVILSAVITQEMKDKMKEYSVAMGMERRADAAKDLAATTKSSTAPMQP